jgi:hypothetical protein
VAAAAALPQAMGLSNPIYLPAGQRTAAVNLFHSPLLHQVLRASPLPCHGLCGCLARSSRVAPHGPCVWDPLGFVGSVTAPRPRQSLRLAQHRPTIARAHLKQQARPRRANPHTCTTPGFRHPSRALLPRRHRRRCIQPLYSLVNVSKSFCCPLTAEEAKGGATR